MSKCNYEDTTKSDIKEGMIYCTLRRDQTPKRICRYCSHKLYTYKELDIGQCFYDTRTKHYGIKLTSCRAYNLDFKSVYGFAGNHANDSDDCAYLKANIEVW